jgi:hypothetical protein
MKQDVTVELFYSDAWHDHTDNVLTRDEIQITRGRADEFSQPGPATATLTFNSWDFNPRNPSSPLHGLIGRNTPLRVLVGASTRFMGEVASWTPRQSLGGPNQTPDRWVLVQAAGITRRLGQGADPLEDSLTRWIPTSDNDSGTVGPTAWWPLDDPPGSRTARSNVPGVAALRPSGQSRYQQPGTGIPTPAAGAPDFGVGDMGPLFSRPFVSLRAGGELAGEVRDLQSNGWIIEMTIQFPLTPRADLPNVSRDILRIILGDDDGGGTSIGTLDLNFTVPADTDFDPQVRLFPGIGPSFATASWFAWDGLPHRYRIFLFRSFAGTENLDVELSIDGVPVASSTQLDVQRGPLRGVLLNRLDHAGPEMPTVGHLAIWQQVPSSIPPSLDSRDPARGYVGEPAGRRIERLCGEEGVPFAGFDLDDTQPMGPQYPGKLLDILREAAVLDGGILADAGTGVPVVSYLNGRRLYNQAAALELDYDAAEVASPLDPVLDDQATRNDITVSRRNGGDQRAVDKDGPLGVDTAGRYKTSIELNAMSDGHDLESQAGWRLHLGTTDQIRFPQVTVDLVATPVASLSAAGSVDIGDRITIDNLPPGLTPDLANLLVQGWTETIGSHRRRITFNCVPEEPHHIAEVAHPDYGIIGGEGFVTDGEFVAGTDTTLSVQSNLAGAWVHEEDFDILVVGVRLRVTAVGSQVLGVQDFTVEQAPINGVVKTIPAGTPVELFHQSYIGL